MLRSRADLCSKGIWSRRQKSKKRGGRTAGVCGTASDFEHARLNDREHSTL